MDFRAEIAVTTNFSFLRGASHPHEYATTAAQLGLAAIGIADRNTLAGIVRAYDALNQLEDAPKLLVGCRLVFVDGTPDILAYPTDRAAYGRLCRLLSEGKAHAVKGECILTRDDLLRWQDGLLLVVMPPCPRLRAGTRDPFRKAWNSGTPSVTPGLNPGVTPPPPRGGGKTGSDLPALLATLSAAAPGRVWLGAAMLYRGDDRRPCAVFRRIADAARVPLIAVNDVLYHAPERRALQDVVTCIREHVTLNEAGRLLEANAERHLKAPHEMARAVSRMPRRAGRDTDFARSHRLFAGSTALQLSRRAGAEGQDRAGHLRRPRLGGGGALLSAGPPGKVAPDDRKGTRAHREARHRALFPHRPRHRRCSRGEEHPLPGARLGGQFGRLLCARHHRRRSRRRSICCSSASYRRAQGAARHRRGFRT